MHLEKDAYLIVSSLNTHGLTLPKKMVYVYCKYSGNDFRLIRDLLGFFECLKRVKFTQWLLKVFYNIEIICYSQGWSLGG